MTRRTALLALGVLPISLHPFSALAQGADPGAPKWYLLKGGTLLDSAGKTRPSTDIAIKDGIVAAIGANLRVTPGFRVIDATKWTIQAGSVNAASRFGLTPPGAADARGSRHPLSTLRADFRAADNYLPDDTATHYRRNGFAFAQILPGAGCISGQSALVSLVSKAATPASRIIQPVTAVVASLASDGQGGYPGSRMGHLALLRQSLTDAREAKSGARQISGSIATLRRVTDRKLPLVVRVSSDSEVEGLLRVVDSEIPLILDVTGPLNRSINAIAKRKAKVIFNVDMADTAPGVDSATLSPLRRIVHAFQTPGKLEKSGIDFVLATAAPDRFYANIRRCIPNGLSLDGARKAIHRNPAAWFDLSSDIKVGDRANISCWTADPLVTEASTTLTFVDGTLSDSQADNAGRPGTPGNAIPAIKFVLSAFDKPVGSSLPQSDAVLIKNATIWTSEAAGIIKESDILFSNGKVTAVGSKLSAPRNARIIDGTGLHVTPGIIDCHSHTAVVGGVNEGTNIITAECRIEDVLDPDDINIYRQLAGGTTAANILHGSANAIGGQNAVVKWRWGSGASALLIDSAPQGIKFALGENPTRSNGSRQGRYPATRMGVERVIRSGFQRAHDYRQAQKLAKSGGGPAVATDYQLEAIAEILEGKRLVHCHSYKADEILAMIRIADDFKFKIATFQHVLEGYKVANEMAAHGAGGSTFSDWWGYKLEAFDAIPSNAAMMHQRGVVSSLNSDSSELARRMNLEAAKSVRDGGLSPLDALNLVTINPAKQLRIDAKTGSLKIGKDADVVLWSKDPLAVDAVAMKTWVDGKLLFDRDADMQERVLLAKEEEALRKQFNVSPKPPLTDVVKACPALMKQPAQVQTKARSQRIALVGGTVHDGVGQSISNATVLINEVGVIEAVGKADAVSVPAGYRKVDVTGKHIAPGFFDAISTVGVNEIGSRRETQDYSEFATYSPELYVGRTVNVDAETVAVAREGGVLLANIVPVGGSLSGSSSLVNLDGWTWEQFAVKRQSGVTLQFGARTASFEGHGHNHDLTSGSDTTEADIVPQPDLGVKVAGLDGFIAEAHRYYESRSVYAALPRDLRFDAFKPILERQIPLLINVDSEREILDALAFATKHNIHPILVGCRGADRVLSQIKASGAGVLLPWTVNLPRSDDHAFDDQYAYPAKFAAAGIPFALTSSGLSDNTRWLPLAAGMATAYGLTANQALESITSAPAKILGVFDQLGSVTKGKQATINVFTGHPLEPTSQISASYIVGVEVQHTSRQAMLKAKWNRRPLND